MNKTDATIGDKIVLYKNGMPFKTVTIVQRKLHMNGLQELFIDTLDEDGEYGNTYPWYRTVSELLESYREYWDINFNIVEKESNVQFNAGDRVIRKEDNKEYIIVYIGHMRNTRRAENEYYLILQDSNDRSRKDTCIYSFDINNDFELVKDKKTTNADRIRKATDEELRNMLFDLISCYGGIVKSGGIYSWLKMEVEKWTDK